MKQNVRRFVFIFAAVLCCAVENSAFAAFGPVTQISLGLNGEQPNDSSLTPVVSANGDVVAYVSLADNLVPDDSNGVADVFVFDRRTNATIRVVGLQGEFENDSETPAISDDGQLVAFVVNGALKVFNRSPEAVQDVISVFTPPYALSGNGRFLVFAAEDEQGLVADDFNSVPDVFLFDRLTQHYERISEPPDGGEANDRSGAPAITPDGRYVAFISSADNLASGSNETESVFVYDRIGGTMERVSGWAAGEAGLLDTGIPPAISVDGRVVSYLAEDTGGTQGVYLRDRVSGTTIRLGVTGPTSPPDFSTNSWLTMSGDGRRFAFGLFGDTESVFVFDRNTATTALVSAAVTGGSADGDSIAARMSRDGRAVVFVSNATNLVPSGPDGFVMNVFLATPNPPVCQRGDVNGDGSVDAADIPALIRSIFGGA